MLNNGFKWVIIFAVFLLAFLVGYLVYKSFKSKAPAWQPSQQITLPVAPSLTPAPAVSGTSSANTRTLPKTGAPVALMAIFASSALISGYFLRKFPE